MPGTKQTTSMQSSLEYRLAVVEANSTLSVNYCRAIAQKWIPKEKIDEIERMWNDDIEVANEQELDRREAAEHGEGVTEVGNPKPR